MAIRHVQAQLVRLKQFTDALMSVRKEDMTLKLITEELRRAYELSYCAIHLFAKTNNTGPVSSGTRSPELSQKSGMPVALPMTLVDVVTEEGPDVQCLS